MSGTIPTPAAGATFGKTSDIPYIRRFTTIVALVMVGASPGAYATLAATEYVTLSARDKWALESQACGAGRKAGKLESWRFLGGSKEIYVEIDCRPFGTIAGLPALKIATCDNTSGRWACPEIATAPRMTFATGEALLSYADSVTPETAIEIATYATTVRSVNGRDVAAQLSGRCWVYDEKSIPFEGAISFNLRCEGWEASITKDCWENRCRLFFTAFDEIIS